MITKDNKSYNTYDQLQLKSNKLSECLIKFKQTILLLFIVFFLLYNSFLLCEGKKPNNGIRAFFLKVVVIPFEVQWLLQVSHYLHRSCSMVKITIFRLSRWRPTYKLDLLEVVNNDVELAPFRNNAIIAQIKHHSDEQPKRYKTMSYIQNGVSNIIFTCIIALRL